MKNKKMLYILIYFTVLFFLIFKQRFLCFNSAHILTNYIAGAIAWGVIKYYIFISMCVYNIYIHIAKELVVVLDLGTEVLYS